MAARAATLHIFCGKIAAGKSSLANEIAASSGGILLSEDHFLSRLYPGGIRTLDDYVRSATRLREAIGPCIQEMLRAGIDVILDFQGNTPRFRAWMRSLIAESGSDHLLHYLRATDTVCRARLCARNAAGNHPYLVSDSDFDLFNSYFVEPSTEEGFKTVIHDQI
ncbi:MAG TPA: ATP-binding protein [Sphingomicrobium sp.]|nr:ATP-binding protein [Sphingomicrobium sp.]